MMNKIKIKKIINTRNWLKNWNVNSKSNIQIYIIICNERRILTWTNIILEHKNKRIIRIVKLLKNSLIIE